MLAICVTAKLVELLAGCDTAAIWRSHKGHIKAHGSPTTFPTIYTLYYPPGHDEQPLWQIYDQCVRKNVLKIRRCLIYIT